MSLSVETAILDLGDEAAGRRADPRYMLHVPVPASLGRIPAVIIDLSLGGAQLRHSAARPDEEFSLRFSWAGERFESRALIVSTRLREIDASGSPSYETRIRFGQLTEEGSRTLKRAVTTLHDARLGEWLANLRGDQRPPLPAGANEHEPAAFFVCTLAGSLWHRRRTHAGDDPPRNGFMVPVSVPPGEIQRMCDLFATLDEDGRELLRLVARRLGREDAQP